ncbi:MAG: hypothetical protein Q7S56_02505 [Nanoarchaeota archaeon]|nr:hypothetical protein [Nanoarchaeota archaeon]
MYKTQNFRIVDPSSFPSKMYSEEEVLITEGAPTMKRTIADWDLDSHIEQTWSELVNELTAKGKGIPQSRPKLGLNQYVSNGNGKLELVIGVTSFREFHGTNIQASKDPDYREKLVQRGIERFNDPYAFFSSMFGLNSAVETADGKIVFGLRGEKTFHYPNCWHVIAGSADIPKDGKVDFFGEMRKEVYEELLVKEGEIDSVKVMGLVRSLQTYHPVISFHTKLGITYDEIERRMKGEGVEEHNIIGAVNIDNLPAFLRNNQDGFSFPQYTTRGSRELDSLRLKSPPKGSTNFFVPDGEATLALYLAHQGFDIERELPYVSRDN